MSQSNIELAKQGYAAFMRGDIPGLLELMTDDIQWVLHSPAEAEPAGGEHKGKAAVAEWFRKLGENYEFEVFSPDEFIASGDKVVVLGHETIRAKTTGRRGEFDWVHIFTYRQGKLARFDAFFDSYSNAQLWRPM
jgi:ketosteroid isomerase-like protein